jgi:hypothetical protein
MRLKPKVKVEPGITLEISFSDRARPVSWDDLDNIRGEVDEIIGHFRPVIR